MSNLLEGRELEFGKLVAPLFEQFPAIPLGEWYRFSFDYVEMERAAQVVHLRFQPIVADPAELKPRSATLWCAAKAYFDLLEERSVKVRQSEIPRFDKLHQELFDALESYAQLYPNGEPPL